MELNEQKIIKECQQGNLEGFGALYDFYIKKIYNFIYYKVHHRESAEDLTSKTFFKALEKIGTYDVKQKFFSAWLYRIARNVVIDHFRTAKPETDIADVWGLSSDQDFNRDLDLKNALGKVDGYLKKLSAEQREIMIMRVWDDLSYREIAVILGKSEAACKMIFSRTLAKLKTEAPNLIAILIILKKLIYE